jgi:hypothetical protein
LPEIPPGFGRISGVNLGTIMSTYQRENILIIRKMFVIAAIFALFTTMTMAQDSVQAEPEMSKEEMNELIKAFTRSAKMDGITLSFVLLNNKTVEALFQGSSKYAMKARANSATTFLVQGVPDKDIRLDPQFEIEQNGKIFNGTTISIQNLEAGMVLRGATISGLFQLSEKIDVTQPFKIGGSQIATGEFKLTEDAIKLLTN